MKLHSCTIKAIFSTPNLDEQAIQATTATSQKHSSIGIDGTGDPSEARLIGFSGCPWLAIGYQLSDKRLNAKVDSR